VSVPGQAQADVYFLALSSNGKRLFLGNSESTIKVWDLPAGSGV
jgi:WD40 repeat protein